MPPGVCASIMIQYIRCSRRAPVETKLAAEGATLVKFTWYLAEVHSDDHVEWLRRCKSHEGRAETLQICYQYPRGPVPPQGRRCKPAGSALGTSRVEPATWNFFGPELSETWVLLADPYRVGKRFLTRV